MPQGKTYVKIASQTLGSNTNSVTFSNLPQNFTDLAIVFNGSISAFDYIYVQYNGDTGSNYSGTILTGTGAAAGSSRHSGTAYMQAIGWATGIQNNANALINIYNYSNSSTFKTLTCRSNDAANGLSLYTGLWRSTSAITSITFTGINSRNILSGSTFTIYGIEAAKAPYATGGDFIATDGAYWYHAFKSSGVFSPLKTLSSDVLIIAGGGGGGGINAGGQTPAGGGGAGGIFYATSQSFSNPQIITIGAGGARTPAFSADGNPGNNSSVGSLTVAVGGGYGSGGGAGGNGGSGGGGRGSGAGGTSTQTGTGGTGYGNAGGVGNGNTGSGGGGGAGAVGAKGTAGGGAGGAGLNTWSAWATATGTGVSGYFAGGGGGGGSGTGGAGGGAAAGGNQGGDGTANTGGGGGGTDGNPGAGGAGGSGLVIVRYAV